MTTAHPTNAQHKPPLAGRREKGRRNQPAQRQSSVIEGGAVVALCVAFAFATFAASSGQVVYAVGAAACIFAYLVRPSPSTTLATTALFLFGLLFHANVTGRALSVRLTVLLAIALSAQVVRQHTKDKAVPLLGVYFIAQTTYLLVSVFISLNDYGGIYTDRMRDVGVILTTVFMLLMYVGGQLGRRFALGRVRERIDRKPEFRGYRPSRCLIVVAGASFFNYIAASRSAASLGILTQVVALASLLASVILAGRVIRGLASPFETFLTIGVLAIQAVLGLGSGSIYSSVGIAFAGGLLALCYRRGRQVLWIAMATLPLLLVLNAQKNDFRQQYWQSYGGSLESSSALTRGASFLTGTTRRISTEGFSSLQGGAARFSTSDSLGFLVDRAPHDFPYWTDGRIYKQIPWIFVPRVLFPWKPPLNYANQFGREVGIASPADFATSVNMTPQVEAYATCGPLCFIAVGGILGSILGWASVRLRSDNYSDVILGAVLAVSLVGAMESGAIALVSIAPLTAVIRWLYNWIHPLLPLASSAGPQNAGGASTLEGRS